MGGITRNSEASIHVEAIEELAESFGSEAAPMVVSIEGQSRRLTGTAAAQYESWRKLLRDIYQAETGFTEEIDVGVPVRAPEPTG
jgi:imidazole glycerol phosphate synthase subunit HisF